MFRYKKTVERMESNQGAEIFFGISCISILLEFSTGLFFKISWAGRRFPVILPHELLPWLMRNGAFPRISCSDLSNYWDHISARRIPVGEVVSDEMKNKCHPLYIWGDDAQYNEQHEKLIVVVLGHVLDPNTYSIQCCWPLFCIREAAWPFW